MHTLQANGKRQHYQNPVWVAMLLLIVGLSVSLHQFKVPPIMDKVGASVHLSPAVTPWLMSVFTLVGLLLALPASSWMRRVPGKKVMVLAMLLVAGGSLLGAAVPSGAIMITSRAIEGVGYLLVSVALPLVAAAHAAPHKIGFVMGIAVIWISAGQIVAMLVTPLLDAIYSWRVIWVAYTGVTIAAAILLLWGLKAVPANMQRENNNLRKGGLIQAFKNKNLLYNCLGLLLFNFCLMIVVTFLIGYANDTQVINPEYASAIATVPTLLGLIGSPVFGALSDKYNKKVLYFVTVLCTGLGTALMFMGSTPLLWVGILLMGLAGCATPSLAFASIRLLIASPTLEEQSNGIAVLFQNAGMFLSTLIYPVLLNLVGGNYLAVSLILLAFSALILFFISRVRYSAAQPIEKN